MKLQLRYQLQFETAPIRGSMVQIVTGINQRKIKILILILQ
jgi:hypothetical protein